jgi:hypothetical protein
MIEVREVSLWASGRGFPVLLKELRKIGRKEKTLRTLSM